MSTNVERMTRSWQGLGAKYATLRATTGVELDSAWWQSYVLGLHLSSGDRRAAVRAKARLSPGSGLTRAAGALAMLAAPAAVVRRQRMRDLRAYDPALTVEAVSWLEALATSNSAEPTVQ